MASITSAGIGSGLDVTSIINKLMAVEQQPLISMQTKEASYQAKISAYGTLKSSVSALNTAIQSLKVSSTQTAVEKYSTYKASVSDSTIASATADSTAVAGSYSLEVTQLAAAHRISTVATAHVLTSAVFSSVDDVVSADDTSLDITVNGATTSVSVTGGVTTLNDLAQAINDANAGVTAEISTDDNTGESTLILTSDTAGSAGTMNLTGLSGFTFDTDTATYELTETQAASGGYTSEDATIAEGTLELTVGDGTVHQITIDSTNSTLAGLRDAINDADAGVTATLSKISDNDVRLVITSNTMGSAGKITMSGLSGFTFDPSTQTGDLSQATSDGGQAAQNAKIKLNGVAITSDTNTVSDAVQGVTLTLSKVTTTATTLTVSQDKTSTLSTALANLAKAYNEFNTTAHTLGGYNADTESGGTLLGNAMLRTVSNSIKNVLQSAVAGTENTNYRYLSNLGLAFQKDGSLVFTSSTLSSATADDFETVATLVSNFASTADTLTDSILDSSDGSIAAATDSAEESIKRIDSQMEAFNRRLIQIEARYKAQFTALDTLMSSMNSTSTYLTQQLASLQNLNSSS